MARDFVPGSSQYLSVGSALFTAEPFSFACWVRADAYSLNPRIFAIDKSTASSWFSLYVDSSLNQLVIQKYDGTTNGFGTVGSVSTGVWYAVGAVWNSTTSRTGYLNGVAATNTTSVGAITGLDGTKLAALDTGTGPTTFWDGQIAEAAMWNAALTDAEMAVLAKGYSPLRVRPENLAHYWPCIGRYSPEIDLVSGIDMTLNASPANASHPRILAPRRSRPITRVPAASITIPRFMHSYRQRRIAV